jgi:putative transposase
LYLEHQIALVLTLRLGYASPTRRDAPPHQWPLGKLWLKRKGTQGVEIATKLAQANDLATQGKLQSEIVRTLGVSVMTLHRWRKAPPGPQTAFVATHEAGQPDRTRGGRDRIAELQLENSRLRQLVTDLLLEKIVLEEATQSQKSPRNGRR